MEKIKWLVWSIEHNAWWRPDHKGYTTFLPDAGVYSYKEALDIVKDANYGLTLPKQKKKWDRFLNVPMEAMVMITPEIEKIMSDPFTKKV